ncbi:antitoxin [Novosphingobium humi]|uniref:antitoxin n=1 Tax=Novosphingobium humi TaxID=2282397 RepID=UPI0025B260A7|nr:antitoxin [Novosphingobium humi]WJT01118.1 antitoxin [Novosphingobium humi]
MSRLTIDMTSQQHQSLKAQAALHGKTVRQYALDRLFPQDGDAAWDELQGLLNERIEQGLSGQISTRTFGEIVDEELGTGPLS